MKKTSLILKQICDPLTVAAARSSSGGVGVAIRYMLPVLWMTSCLHTLGVSTVDTFAASDESGRVHRARGAGGEACNAALPCLLVHGPLTEDHFWICSCVKVKVAHARLPSVGFRS